MIVFLKIEKVNKDFLILWCLSGQLLNIGPLHIMSMNSYLLFDKSLSILLHISKFQTQRPLIAKINNQTSILLVFQE